MIIEKSRLSSSALIITFIASFTLLIGCSAASEEGDFNIESLPELEMRQAVQFSESEDMLLGSISQLFTDSEGNIILVDGQQRILHATDPEGNYIQQIGATGSGPGEYQFPGLVSIGPDDAVHLMNWASRTIITFRKENGGWVFDSDFVADQEKVGFPSNLFPLGSGEFYITSGSISINDEDNSVIFRQIDNSSDILRDSILIAPSNESFTIRDGDLAMMSLSQSDMHRQARYTHDYNGTIYYGWSDSLSIMKMPAEDDSFSLYANIELPETPFTSADGDTILATYESLLEGNSAAREDLISTFPESKPVFSNMLADETGYLWVQLQLPEGDRTWLVLDQNGEPVYTATFEEGHTVHAVRNGKVYTVSRSDLDVPTVHVYDFNY